MKIPFRIKKISHRGGGKEASLQNPERDWLIILIVGCICIVAASAYHVYFYNLVEAGAFYGGDETVKEEASIKLDTKRVERAMVQINEREKWTEVLSSVTPRIIDPSR